MKIIFAGTPEFAIPTLERLLASRHQVIAVYTQPDRPAGRGRKLTPTPIKIVAEKHEIPLYQPASLRPVTVQQELAALHPDVMVVVAYGLLLPKAVLTIPTYGCINVHPSLLSRWRGAAPIQRAVLAGDEYTGVATMQLDVGMDTGPILLLEKTPIKPLETSGDLHDRLAMQGAELLIQTLDKLERGELIPVPQADDGVTHAAKITKAEARLEWSLSAKKLQQAVCAYNPWPVAYTLYQGQVLRIWEANAVSDSCVPSLREAQCRSNPVLNFLDHHAALVMTESLNVVPLVPGTIINMTKTGIDVATGDGVLQISKVQLAGGKIVSAADFLNREQHNILKGVTKFE